MANDTIVIRYTIELVVSSGGALSGHKTPANLAKPSVIQVTPLLHKELLHVLRYPRALALQSMSRCVQCAHPVMCGLARRQISASQQSPETSVNQARLLFFLKLLFSYSEHSLTICIAR